ncbi:hypothetical protein DY000_02039047 [Brassica cretica]|uniref:Uncharacterized protein n=1 Tax=Brassica cretica TaxID=69181 RepID=A0ABQ7B8N3_BRACR|nr:hypothetical protein DY000_02039047 [Brassica cretica]
MLFAWICKFALSNTPTRASMCDGDPVLQHRRYLCREVLIQRIEVQSRHNLMDKFLWSISCGHILMDGFWWISSMMDIKETIERSYGCEEASTVEQVENDDIKIAGHGAMVNGGRGLKPKEGQWKNFVVAEDLRWKAVNDLTETMA